MRKETKHDRPKIFQIFIRIFNNFNSVVQARMLTNTYLLISIIRAKSLQNMICCKNAHM